MSSPAGFHFHAAPPADTWLNDPNGLVHVDGRYRLFAQHSAAAPDFKEIGWGAFSSPDLLSWAFDGVAIAGTHARSAYSGCVTEVAPFEAFLTLHDTSGPAPVQRQHRVVGNLPIVSSTPLGPEGRNVRDPYVFRCAATDDWRMLVAEPCDWTAWRTTPSSTLAIWASPDKRDWRHVGRIGPWDPDGVMWEVPLLLDFGEAQVLVVSKVDRRGDGARSSVDTYVGRFDGTAFTASGAAVPLDLGPDFYAACANTSAGWPDKGRVVVGWASNWATARAIDWPGGMKGGPISLPRAVALAYGRATVAPIAAALPLATWRGRWLPGRPLALVLEGEGVVLRFGIDAAGRLGADRTGDEPLAWALAEAVMLTEPTEIVAFVDAGLIELFFAGRSLTAFVPGAQTVGEYSHGLG